jgi:PhzF family phenazine biosynthesis protein
MRIPIYQVDAFTDRLFAGNPAAVCPLPEWLPADLMQAIAAENNLSETAFFVAEGPEYSLRWFTPAVEVDLCGHATLASAYVVLQHLRPDSDSVVFHTKSGGLEVVRGGDRLVMDLPSYPPQPCEEDGLLRAALGVEPEEVLLAHEHMAVYPDEAAVRALAPDMEGLKASGAVAVIVTAPGTDCDFVSRFFAPKFGIPEDPVTGSAHCALTPYWSERLGKRRLHARQVSPRGGELHCELKESRVAIAGRAVLYLEGTIEV